MQEYLWQSKTYDSAQALFYHQNFNIDPIIARIIACNENISPDNIKDFLDPKIRNLMPNPYHLLDMNLAVERIYSAIINNEKIALFGDYDVDGATGTAIIYNFLSEIGVLAEIYIPDRITEGYGPNTEALLSLRKRGAKLLITIDCGTLAFEPLQKAYDAGLDSIVIDHHIGVHQKPQSIAVINPNRYDETSNLTYLCAAGVTFMLIVALNSHLRKMGFYNKEILEPDMTKFLGLVALGTICDVMQIRGLNRAFVRSGLKILNKQENIGLNALMNIAGFTDIIDEYCLGFVFGPRINAGGRVGKSTLGAELLTCKDPVIARKIAQELHQLNDERKQIEQKMQDDAMGKAIASNDAIIFIGNKDFHQGVIGILAARIKDAVYKPSIIYTIIGDTCKASCRSVFGVDIGSAINKATQKGLLLAGGGHAAAAGFSCETSKMNDLKTFLLEEIGLQATQAHNNRTIFYDAEVDIPSINLETFNNLQILRPFGLSNPKPKFLVSKLIVLKYEIRGQKHSFLLLKCGKTIKTIKAMFFNSLQNDSIIGKTIDVISEFSKNEWNGNISIELNIIGLKITT